MSMACIKTADGPSQVRIRVAVIVPTYKQPGLLAEALDTALRQRCDFGYSIIVVEDGCPFPETAQVCRDFAAAHPGRIHHLRKRNNGLGAARNTGIEFALAAFPGLEAVYFLDSDNRIQPLLLQRLFDALHRSGPEIGWAYPDIDKFGFPEFCDTSGDYSPLEHLFRNVAKPGAWRRGACWTPRGSTRPCARVGRTGNSGCRGWSWGSAACTCRSPGSAIAAGARAC